MQTVTLTDIVEYFRDDINPFTANNVPGTSNQASLLYANNVPGTSCDKRWQSIKLCKGLCVRATVVVSKYLQTA